MYMSGVGALIATPQQKDYIGTPTEYLGTGCPAGMIATQPSYRDNNQNWVTKCATIRPAAPVVQQAAPTPAPSFNPTITVSPSIQSYVSPQISPGFIQSSGGGTQATGATQTAGGQSGSGGGSGLTAADLQNILAEQEKQRAAEQAAAQQQAQQQAAALAAQQQAATQAQIEALKAQQDKANAEQQAAYEKQIADLQRQQSAQAAPSSTVIVPTQTAQAPAVPTQTNIFTPTRYAELGIGVVVIAGALYFLSRSKKHRGR